MTKITFSIFGAASLLALGTAASAEVDRLSEAEIQRIEIAFDQVLDRPATLVDALSADQWSTVVASYDSLGALDSAADTLPQSRLSMMNAAYDSLDTTALPVQ